MESLREEDEGGIDHGYLKNKRRGGDSNQKGGLYERLFAVSKIVELAAANWDMIDDMRLSAQVYAYVDDLCIWNGAAIIYHQLKSGSKVSWGKSDRGSLRYDFEGQMRMSIRNSEDFRLKLVVSSEQVALQLVTDLPDSIREVAEVIHFPEFETTFELVSHPAIRANLRHVCSTPDASLSWLDSIAKLILGIWDGSGQNDLSIGAIMDQLRQIQGALVRRRVPLTIHSSLRAVLDGIEGFTYWEEGGYLRWRFGGSDAGVIIHPIGSSEFSTVEDSILKSWPVDFHNLEPLIS